MDQRDFSQRIDAMVNCWDDIDIEEKRRILQSWENKINDSETYDQLLTIVENFRYYSENQIENTFKRIFDNDINFKYFDTNELLSDNSKDTNFIVCPFTTKTTIESSQKMYSLFIEKNNLNWKFSDYCRLSLFTLSHEMEDLDNLIENPTECEKLTKKEKNIRKKLLKIFKGITYIFLIDDFIGTGSSIINFIEENYKTLNNIYKFLKYLYYCAYKDNDYELTFIFVVLESMSSAKKEIMNVATRLLNNGIKIVILEGQISESVFQNNSVFENDEENIKEKFYQIINEKNLRISEYNRDLNIGSYYNTPNNTFPLISQPETPTELWEGLFSRKISNHEYFDEDDVDYFASVCQGID